MAITINTQQNTDVMSPLGALIAHFNSSSISVRRTFSKLITESIAQEQQSRLQAKVMAGVKDIKEGRGLSRGANETTEQFFDRLCTE